MDALQQLNSMIADNENILWYGKPNKKCFLLEAIFNPLLPFAVIWGIIDFAFIGALLRGDQAANPPPLFFIIPFFALHLMPVWIYLIGVFFSFRNHKNTCFVVTEKGVYSSGGFLASYFKHKAYSQIAEVSVRQGFFDTKLNVGDIIITDSNRISDHDLDDFCQMQRQHNKESSYQMPAQTPRIEIGQVVIGKKRYATPNNDIIFHDIPDFLEVYQLIQEQLQKHQK